MQTFNALVEKIKVLTFEEKEELHLLLEKYLAEARRDEIKKNYQKSKKEKHKYSCNIKDLKDSL
jgi:hypothetical protein